VTHRHRIRSLTALMGSAAVAVIAGASPAAAHHAATATPVGAQSARLITLVTGQRILESTGADGRLAFTEDSTAASSPLLTFEANSTWYAVPAAVMHSLGGQLDPGLFETAALSDAEAGTSGSVPVQVQWHGGAAPVMAWLLQQVAVAPGVTDGVVTSASGSVLQASLSAGSLPGIDRISLKGAVTSPRRATSGFSLYTLTVNGIDAEGRPDTGDAAILINTDNALNAAGVGFEQWYHGIFKVSVPNGHYALLGDFVHFSKTGTVNGGGPPSGGTERMSIVNFTVHGNTAVTVDARTATARLSVTTPLPTDIGSGVATWQRDSKGTTGGTSFSSLWSFGGGAPSFEVFVSPTPAPSIGTQAWLVNYHLDSPATTPAAYSYDLTYGGLGAISAEQHENATAAHLATIATRYFSNVPNQPTLELRQSFFPWQFAAIGEFDSFNAPLDRTEYVAAASDLLWIQQVVADANSFQGDSEDSYRIFVPGATSSSDWNRGPIGPGVAVDTGPMFLPEACPACTEGGALEFVIFPFGDNPPGHYGFPNASQPGLTETDAYTLERDGVVISSGQDPLGISVPVTSGSARYQLQYSVAMSAVWRTLSTQQTTTWSFSSPSSTRASLPSGWLCFSGTSAGCSVVALMLPDYQLPESDTGTVASGPVRFQLRISHILGVPVAVTSAQVSVSFDGGTTWVTAHVAPSGPNNFAVSYRDPSHAGTAAIRIHVTDADGGVLDQTILNAYAFP
jgi:hypothetical protein